MNRYALLVGNSNYEDPALRPLPSAVRDVKALQQILINPEIGGFAESEVRVLMDADRKAIEDAIWRLFADRKRDDLLLFYFSGHGVTEPKSKDFYLTTSKTLESKAPPSSVWAGYIHLHMNNSNSKCKVIILDCCFSGAFTKGMKGNETLDIVPQFAGEGRAILTASNSSQYAFEQPGYELSLYTHFLVKGLKTGEADLNGDGNISVFELHEYVEKEVTNINDRMSPQFDNHNKGREIILAKAALNNSFKFRKEVEEFAHDGNGELSIFAKLSLDVSRQELGIAPGETETIINEVLRPYQEYAKKLEVYEQALRDTIAHKFPFSKVVQAHLQKCENRLVLREEDLQAIKERILAPKQAEYEQQLQAAQRQAERLQQEAAERQAAELLQQQQVELLHQQQLEAEKRLTAERQQAKLEQERQEKERIEQEQSDNYERERYFIRERIMAKMQQNPQASVENILTEEEIDELITMVSEALA